MPKSGGPEMNERVPSIGSSDPGYRGFAASLRTELLAEDAVRGEARYKDGAADVLLRLAVGDGDGALVGLVLDRDAGAEVAQGNAGRRLGNIERGFEEFCEVL